MQQPWNAAAARDLRSQRERCSSSQELGGGVACLLAQGWGLAGLVACLTVEGLCATTLNTSS
jgi:hypothetical protein